MLGLVFAGAGVAVLARDEPSVAQRSALQDTRGRIVVTALAGRTPDIPRPAGPGALVPLPDGRVTVFATEGLVAVRLLADGVLDPTFGDAGTARVRLATPLFVQQVLRRPDGRMIVVGEDADGTGGSLPRFVIVGLMADGALDRSFGTRGVTRLGLSSLCGGCNNAALAPDGSIVITGTVGTRLGTYRWLVRRLTPAGLPDAAFGRVTMPDLAVPIRGPADSRTGGLAAAVRPNGAIVLAGLSRGRTTIVGLTATGTRDAQFNGGRLLRLAMGTPTLLLLQSDGASVVTGEGAVVRVTSDGKIDRSYGRGDDGAVTLAVFNGVLQPGPEDTLLLAWDAADDGSAGSHPRMQLRRISRTGELGPTRRISPSFGGGVAEDPFAVKRPALAQNSFGLRDLAIRPDGSVLVAGDVTVEQQTGGDFDAVATYVGVAALTPSLEPDLTFGGMSPAPAARVRFPTVQLRRDARRRRMIAFVTASDAGLLRLRVEDSHGRRLGRRTRAVYKPGRLTVTIPLTAAGVRVVRAAATLRIRVAQDFRDLLARRQRATHLRQLR